MKLGLFRIHQDSLLYEVYNSCKKLKSEKCGVGPLLYSRILSTTALTNIEIVLHRMQSMYNSERVIVKNNETRDGRLPIVSPQKTKTNTSFYNDGKIAYSSHAQNKSITNSAGYCSCHKYILLYCNVSFITQIICYYLTKIGI